MTEEAWLRTGNPGQLLTYIRKQPRLRGNQRRLGLFSMLCVTRLCAGADEIQNRAMEIVGRLADGESVPFAEREELSISADSQLPGTHAGSYLLDALRVFDFRYRQPVEERAKSLTLRLAPKLGKGESAFQCSLIRDIFGNPFRPVAFPPEWRTDTATALARGVYESRDFAAMPILADALQDVGCDSDDILTHCRDAQQVHVRGCWVVDLVLGKA